VVAKITLKFTRCCKSQFNYRRWEGGDKVLQYLSHLWRRNTPFFCLTVHNLIPVTFKLTRTIILNNALYDLLCLRIVIPNCFTEHVVVRFRFVPNVGCTSIVACRVERVCNLGWKSGVERRWKDMYVRVSLLAQTRSTNLLLNNNNTISVTTYCTFVHGRSVTYARSVASAIILFPVVGMTLSSLLWTTCIPAHAAKLTLYTLFKAPS
jgi:hypothetical protein